MIRRYLINSLRRAFHWESSATQLDFKRTLTRMPKRLRSRVNDAVALLKGVGWLTPHRFEVETVESITIELAKLESFIMEQHLEIMRRFNVRDGVVLMGPKHFYELTKATINQPLRISMADFQVGKPQSQFNGMSVVVLPWMEGTILIPKEYLPIDRELVPSGIMVTAETQRKLDEEREGRFSAALWDMQIGRNDEDLE